MTHSQQPKIVIVSRFVPPFFGGGGLRAYRCADELNKIGKLAFLLTQRLERMAEFQPRKNSICHYESEALAHKIQYLPDISRSNRRFSIFFECIVFLCSMIKIFIRNKDFQILHCFGSGSWLSLFSVFLGRLFGKRTILEMTLLGSDDPITINSRQDYESRLKAYLFSCADVCVSRSRALTVAYFKSSSKTRQLFETMNPVDLKEFAPVSYKEKQILRRKLNIPESAMVVLCVGSIIKRKGIATALHSFHALASNYPNLYIYFVGAKGDNAGNIEYYIQMQNLVLELGLSRVEFTGLANNVHEYMKASDIFLFTSEREGSPNVVNEAMATGLPIVAHGINGEIAELIENGKDGIIVDRYDPSEFAKHIKILIEDVNFRNSLSYNARSKAKTLFSFECVLGKYLDLYDNLINRRP